MRELSRDVLLYGGSGFLVVPRVNNVTFQHNRRERVGRHTGGGFSFFCMVIIPIRFCLFTGASSFPLPENKREQNESMVRSPVV